MFIISHVSTSFLPGHSIIIISFKFAKVISCLKFVEVNSDMVRKKVEFSLANDGSLKKIKKINFAIKYLK